MRILLLTDRIQVLLRPGTPLRSALPTQGHGSGRTINTNNLFTALDVSKEVFFVPK